MPANYKEREDLIDENRLLKHLTKLVVGQALEAEIMEHLDYGKHEMIANGNCNDDDGDRGHGAAGQVIFGKVIAPDMIGWSIIKQGRFRDPLRTGTWNFPTMGAVMQVRAIFISDLHLGTRACQAERLVDFLREHPSEYLYLLGDIVDFWAMSRGGIHWSRAQNTVIQKVLRRARHGNIIIFIPGNHDEALREYVGMAFGDIRLEREYVHTSAEGKRYLLIHGDEFDQVTRYHHWVAILGDISYNFLVGLNAVNSWLRRTLQRPGYWSLAGYAKRKVKTAVNFIFDFEDSVLHHVRERGFDGVVCGHIHWAEIKQIEGLTYMNCGDWVDSCTAIIERLDGCMELVVWHGDLSTDNSD